jgi:hypothetical protein
MTEGVIPDVSVQLNAADFSRFNREYCWTWRRMLPIGVWMVVVFVSVFILTYGLFRLEDAFDVAIGPVGTFVITLSAMFLLLRLLQPIRAKVLRQDLSPLMTETHFRLSEEGFSVATDSVDASYRWKAFKDVVVTPHAAYLGIGANRAIIVPKRAFASAEAFEQFVSVFRQRTGLLT